MTKSRDAILADVLQHLRQLADDWEYEGEITPATTFFGDLGLESLDVVVLAAAVQEQYGQALPFPEFFAQVGQRKQPEITVAEWVDFVYTNLQPVSAVSLNIGQTA